jgi:uncharacterized protein (TIGR00730 family)
MTLTTDHDDLQPHPAPVPPQERTRLLERIAGDAARIAHRSELELCANVVGDLASAIETLAPYEDRPKITIFGSARLKPTDPSYEQVRRLADALGRDGYVVVTGGGPGIMTAGLEGAGNGNAVGVSIRLPFETPAFHLDIPVVRQEHFPTRKLSMIRHVRGFVAAAGGLGTLDEIAEVLTLIQTGHKQPTPVVLMDDGTGIWAGFTQLMEAMAARGLVDESDAALYAICSSWEDTYAHLSRFWSRYRGCHGAASALVLRLATPVDADELGQIQQDFPDLNCVAHTDGLLCGFDGKSYGRLRCLIDALNGHAAAVPGPAPADDGHVQMGHSN